MDTTFPQIFLDFDHTLKRSATDHSGTGLCFDPANVAVFNQIIEAAGAHIVVSSGWRNGHSLNDLGAALAAAGLQGQLVASSASLQESASRPPEVSQGTAVLRWRESQAPD
jgi:hypothetical protein